MEVSFGRKTDFFAKFSLFFFGWGLYWAGSQYRGKDLCIFGWWAKKVEKIAKMAKKSKFFKFLQMPRRGGRRSEVEHQRGRAKSISYTGIPDF